MTEIDTMPDMIAVKRSIKLPVQPTDQPTPIHIPVSVNIEKSGNVAMVAFLFVLSCISFVNALLLFLIVMGIIPLARG